MIAHSKLKFKRKGQKMFLESRAEFLPGEQKRVQLVLGGTRYAK